MLLSTQEYVDVLRERLDSIENNAEVAEGELDLAALSGNMEGSMYAYARLNALRSERKRIRRELLRLAGQILGGVPAHEFDVGGEA